MKSIKEKALEIKGRHGNRFETVLTALIIILTGLLGFGLGQMSTASHSKMPVRIEEIPLFQNATVSSASGASAITAGATVVGGDQTGQVVGSRNSDKYHYPWCSGAQRIGEANKVWFVSVEEARAAGYTPAGNCPGLK